jgi:hypothetical protein
LKYGDVTGLSLLIDPRPILLEGASPEHHSALAGAFEAAGASRDLAAEPEMPEPVFLAPAAQGPAAEN